MQETCYHQELLGCTQLPAWHVSKQAQRFLLREHKQRHHTPRIAKGSASANSPIRRCSERRRHCQSPHRSWS